MQNDVKASGPASNDRTTQAALLLDEAAHPVRPGRRRAKARDPRRARVPRPRRRADVVRVRQPRTRTNIAFFPRSGEVSLRGIGLRFRVGRLDYWDGEPD